MDILSFTVRDSTNQKAQYTLGAFTTSCYNQENKNHIDQVCWSTNMTSCLFNYHTGLSSANGLSLHIQRPEINFKFLAITIAKPWHKHSEN